MPNSEAGGSPRTETLEGARVLVVEDEVIIGMDLCDALADAGAHTSYARDIDQAMDFVDRQSFDAAILDVTLGRDTTSVQVARSLQARGVPYVIYSGDLDRKGELLRELDGPVLRKPTAMPLVMRGLAAAMTQSRPAA